MQARHNFRDVVFFAVEGWQHLLDGFEKTFGRDLAEGAFVGPFGGMGNPVTAIVIPPGLDGLQVNLRLPSSSVKVIWLTAL